VIGVVTEQHTKLTPELPTLAETLPGFHANSWYGLFAPAGTPKAIVERIAAEGNRVLADPALVERLAGQGAEPAPSGPARLATLLRDDLKRWQGIVKDSGAKID
jgi:tripartite-type tricarboxylate transporter receptor subunit TctC